MTKPAHIIGEAEQIEDVPVDAVLDQHEASGDVRAIRRDDFDRDVWCLLGLPVDVTDVSGAMGEIDRAVRNNKRLSFVTPNVNWLVRSFRDQNARKEMLEADLSLVDGAPLVALAKLLGVPTTSRVAGSDLFEALRRRPAFASEKLRVFFFGGRNGAAETAMQELNREKSGIEAVGCYNPGFGDLDSMSAQPILDKINEAKPDFVVVALGAEKGQAWINRNQTRLVAPVLAHLGAVIDFTAGGISRAPRFIQKIGLEWVWRIKEEPALWRRYFEDGLSLAHIAVARLLPQLLFASRATSDTQASARVDIGSAKTTIVLAGDIHQSSMRPIREAFRRVAAMERDVCLDFSGVASFDRAFLGLVLMLEKHLTKSGQKIYINSIRPSHLRVLNANQMGYPISEAAARQHGALPATHQAAV